jgi:hypothetical protein
MTRGYSFSGWRRGVCAEEGPDCRGRRANKLTPSGPVPLSAKHWGARPELPNRGLMGRLLARSEMLMADGLDEEDGLGAIRFILIPVSFFGWLFLLFQVIFPAFLRPEIVPGH